MARNDVQKKKGFEVVKVPEKSIEKLDEAANSLQAAGDMAPGFRQVFMVAEKMAEMRQALQAPGILDNIMSLQGNPLGFGTEKEKGSNKPRLYPRNVVADVTLWATMQGAYMAGNEVQIIRGKGMLIKSYYIRKIRELERDGLLQYHRIDYGVPKMVSGGAVTEVIISWKRTNGKHQGKTLSVPVKKEGNQGVDAILGKTERRARQWLYEEMTGKSTGDIEEGAGGVVIDVKAEPVDRPDVRAPKDAKPDPEPKAKPKETTEAKPAKKDPVEKIDLMEILAILKVPQDVLREFFIGTKLIKHDINELRNEDRRDILKQPQAWRDSINKWADAKDGTE